MLFANFFVIGGPISVGKSTLVDSLPFPSVTELDEKNKLENMLLEGTYTKKRIKPELIEFYFLKKRELKYERFANTLVTHVLDRSIFESLWFAKENLSKKSFKHFETLFDGTVRRMLKKYGKPKNYFILDLNWETFYERIFNRSREEEVNNFSKNQDFFKKHIKEYSPNMKKILNKYKVDFLLINTDGLSANEIHNIVIEEIRKVNNEK